MSEPAMLNWVLFLPVIGMAMLISVPRSHGLRAADHALGDALQFLLTCGCISVPGRHAGTAVRDAAAVDRLLGRALPHRPRRLQVLLVLLTTFLGPLVVAGAFSAIQKDVKLFYAMVFFIQFAMLGTFLAQDLFLFYVFWEAMLIPMFLIIGIWGASGASMRP